MFDQTTTQNPYGAPMNPAGYAYQGYQGGAAAPKIMNVLTPEEIKELQQERSQFSLGLTQRESMQAKCNHRTADGTKDSLVFDQETGKARCTICGYEFRPVEAETSYESIVDASERIIDILQTIKLLYTDLPPAAAAEYFQIIPLIGKIPQLFEFAAKNFAKHEYNAWNYNQYNMGGISMLQGLSNLFGASQPTYGYGAPQMGMPQAQQPYGFYGAPQGGVPMTPPQGNPFGYPGAGEQQPVGYQPAATGYQYTPGQPAPAAPAAPQAPAADAVAPAETVTQKVTV